MAPAGGSRRHSRAARRRRPGSVSFTSAPAFSSTRTTSMRPSRTANSSGVKPDGRRASEIGAGLDQRPARRRRGLPPPPTSAPSARAGRPCALTSRAVRQAAPSRRRALPVRAAVISAVSPPGSAAFGSAPAFEQQLDHRARCRSCRPARAASRRSDSPPSRWRRRAPAASRSLQIVVVRRPVQRRHAVGLRRVHVDALLRAARERCARSICSRPHPPAARRRRRRATAARRAAAAMQPAAERVATHHAGTRQLHGHQSDEQFVDLALCCRRRRRGGRRPCRAASGADWPAASAPRT